MKGYTVIFDRNAYGEALAAADYIARSSPQNSDKWFAGLREAIDSLRTMPARCGLARESAALGVEVRQRIYHSHRIIFRIEEEAAFVRILHVRHAARRSIGEG